MIRVEASSVSYEADVEDNICYGGPVTVLPSEAVHDLAVILLRLSSNEVYEGWVVHANVTIANFGNATETFTATLYYNDTVISSVTINEFEPNATLTLNFDWNTTGIPCHCNYIVKAAVTVLPNELNATNNELISIVRVKLLGDIDDNGVVEMFDIGIVCQAYGAHFGHPRWNVACDIDNNGIIDLRDIGIVCVNFRRTS